MLDFCFYKVYKRASFTRKGLKMTMKTTKTIKPADCDIKWYLVDATDLVLGRLATQLSAIIRGKTKPCYTPTQDCGDFVVVVNAEKIRVTGRKLEQKEYFHHSGYVGGIKGITLEKQLEKDPTQVLIKAVERMVSRGPLGSQQMTKLRVYAGADHPHKAQQPIALDIGSRNPKNKRSV